MRASRLKMGIGTIAVAALATGAAVAPASGASYKPCGTFSGAAWAVAAFGKKGTQWHVLAAGVTCSYARTWSIKLAKTPFKGEAGTKLRGPVGWKCLPGIAESKGTAGQCWKGATQAGPRFSWGPDIK
jgi:hypothetical protein